MNKLLGYFRFQMRGGLFAAGSRPSGSLAAPTAFPASGRFEVAQRITLLSSTPGASIHYTLDGSLPTPASPLFDPFNLIFLDSPYEGKQAASREFTIKAVAVSGGQTSPPASFSYTIARRDTDTYISREITPGVRMICDYEDDKFYLLTGSQKALLVDTGMGTGDLRKYVESFCGGLPLEVVITHAHPDHVGQLGQFQNDCPVYMNLVDVPMVKNFIEHMHFQIDPLRFISLQEGQSFDLGGRRLDVYEVPGHTRGSIVLLDEQNGLLFAGDALGNNRPTIVDALWMQHPGMAPIDEYLSTVQVFRARVGNKIREIYNGHNDTPLNAPPYLENLEKTAQTLVDQGPGALTPSLRPTGVWQMVTGDRIHDPNWVGINVTKEGCLSVPAGQIATLSNISLSSGQLSPGFKPSITEYTAEGGPSGSPLAITATATSRRVSSLTVNGRPAHTATSFPAVLNKGANRFRIQVVSPDGSQIRLYTLIVTSKDL